MTVFYELPKKAVLSWVSIKLWIGYLKQWKPIAFPELYRNIPT